MLVCEQRAEVAAGHVDFPSKSNPAKSYRVYAFRPGEMPMCTCMPFLTSRKKAWKAAGGDAQPKGVNEFLGTCNHIKKVFKDTCQWDATAGGSSLNGCPKCGGDVVEVVDGDTMIVETPVDRDDAIQAALRTRAKLSGEEYIEPEAPASPKRVRVIVREVHNRVYECEVPGDWKVDDATDYPWDDTNMVDDGLVEAQVMDVDDIVEVSPTDLVAGLAKALK